MKKSKKSSKSGDRLSELPDSLIFEIFWLLPMREVVRTTILSHRWKNLWTTAPYLSFKDCQVKIDADKVRNFVNRALMMWRGTRIQRFRLDFGSYYRLDFGGNHDQSLYSDIDLWLLFATKCGVEDLFVELDFYCDGYMEGMEEEMYRTPECLYSCSSLKRLCLRDCNIHVPMKNVNWNQLEHFQILGSCEFTKDSINQVLCGSPQLGVFCLDLTVNHDNMTIQSSSLKHLFINKYSYYCARDLHDPCIDTGLNICTPNLELLQMEGLPYRKCSMNVPSLTRANLLFEEDEDLYGDLVGETLGQILPTIQHVEQLKLSYSCIEALGLVAMENKNMLPPFSNVVLWQALGLVAMENKNMLPPFPNVEELELNGCSELIVHLLEIFPKLEMLVLQLEEVNERFNDRGSPKFEANPLKKNMFEANFPDSFLQELRTVRITWVEGEDSIFPVIEFLLKYASKLEKMVFQVKETGKPSKMALQKLLRMPRSSPTAKLIVL